MGFEKPMTENKKEQGNKLYKFMMTHDIVTKEQMLAYLGWGKEKDRQLRDLISMIAQKVPVVALSSNRGYKIARTVDDLEAVENTWAELSSRVEEIQKRIEPLVKFRDRLKYNI